jgi:hypothetical protein
VLAYKSHVCAPTVKTGPDFQAKGGRSEGSNSGSQGSGICSEPNVEVAWHGFVDPNGSKTTYHFQYGSLSTKPRHVPASHGTVEVSESTVVHNQTPALGECAPVKFRIIASNGGGPAHGKYSELRFYTDEG